MRFVVTSDRGNVVVLRDGQLGNEVGVWLLQDGVEGWHGTPPPREGAIERSMTDADFMPRTLTQGSRTVTLHGCGVFETSIEAAAFMASVNGMMGVPLTVMCEDASGRKHARGFLADDPAPQLLAGEQAVMFTFVITCPDPKKYGREMQYKPSGGWCMVVNEGNTGTYPVVHVDGPVSMLHLELGSQGVTWNGSAESLDLDFADMQPSSGSIVLDNAFEIPPGRSAMAVSCDGAVTVTVRSAWR